MDAEKYHNTMVEVYLALVQPIPKNTNMWIQTPIFLASLVPMPLLQLSAFCLV